MISPWQKKIDRDPTGLVIALGDVIKRFTDFSNKEESLEIFCPGLSDVDRESIEWFSNALTSSLDGLAVSWRDAPLKIEPDLLNNKVKKLNDSIVYGLRDRGDLHAWGVSETARKGMIVVSKLLQTATETCIDTFGSSHYYFIDRLEEMAASLVVILERDKPPLTEEERRQREERLKFTPEELPSWGRGTKGIQKGQPDPGTPPTQYPKKHRK